MAGFRLQERILGQAPRSRRSSVMDAGPVEVFEAAGLLEAGPLEAELEPPVVSAVDLIGQYDLQERCVVELLPACEGDPSPAGC